MAEEKYTLSGRIIRHDTKAPVEGVRVDAFQALSWGSQGNSDESLGHAVTDKQGRFYIEFIREFTLLDLTRQIDLFFNVYADDSASELIHSTSDSVCEGVNPGKTSIEDIEVELKTEEQQSQPESTHKNDERIVTGRVEYEDGTAAPNLLISAYDRDIGRHRTPLGDEKRDYTTNENGAFPEIRYSLRQFEEGEGQQGPNADLVFEITDLAKKQTVEITAIFRHILLKGGFVDSKVPDPLQGFEAGPVEDVRIVIAGRPKDAGLSEYARLMRDLKPLLINASTPADLDQEHCRDFDFVARETGWERDLIETLHMAWRLAIDAHDPRRLAETFYGLLRKGPPTAVPPLPAELQGLLDNNGAWQRKLEDSLANRIIDGELKNHLQILREWRAATLAVAGAGTTAGIGDVLQQAGISEQLRRDFLVLYQAHEGSIEDFWRKTIPEHLGWDKEKVGEVQTALQFGELTAYHLPLTDLLQKRGYKNVRDLTALDPKDWREMLEKVGPPPDAPGEKRAEQIARMVDSIVGLIDASYPTEVMAHIAATSDDKELAAARDLLNRFFDRETAQDGETGKFDMRTSPVTAYLETHEQRVFHGLKEDQRTLLKSQLQRLQRGFQLGVNRDQTQALLDLGLDSAYHIVRYSPEHFLSQYGAKLGGEEAARMLYSRAEHINGTLLYVYSDLWQGTQGVKPLMFKSPDEPEKLTVLKENPTYRALFGRVEMCSCEHCRSFYSPAAYFVDLLHMLDDHRQDVNPVEVLFNRRPDLGHIQLTCENTNTLIPYVDLVAEILESFVANHRPVPFNKPPSPPDHILPSPSADELAVNPVYLTSASATFSGRAYTALQEANFPLNLPLNLPLETVRVYLDHLGVSRAELMPIFDADLSLETLMAQAAEVLRLSPEEFELLTGAEFGGASAARPATLAEFFGLSSKGNPSTSFNHAAPEFAPNDPPPHREALIRSLQNVLIYLTNAPGKVTGIFDPVNKKEDIDTAMD